MEKKPKPIIDIKKYRPQLDDWLNLNTFMAVAIYAFVAVGSMQVLKAGAGKAHISEVLFPLLMWMVTLLPGLIIVLAFGAYRSFYHGRIKARRNSRRIVTWQRYALPLTILMSLTTLFLTGFLYEDMVFSAHIYSTGFAFGTFAFPIYFGETEIDIPSAIFWFGYVGYLMTLIGVTLRRMITNNLVPHFYIASSFGLIKSLVAAAIIFLAANGLPDFFAQGAAATQLNPRLAILIAFVAGATADDIINWLIARIRHLLGRNVSDPLPLSLVQGIDPTLEAYLHEEGIDSIQILATISLPILIQKTNLDENTLKDWQIQASFLRNFTSPALAERFHRLGINEHRDLENLDETELAKALAAVNEKNDLGNEEVNTILLKVLKADRQQSREMQN
jgi:hypothetical protein